MEPLLTRPITVEIPHKLGAAEARRRLEAGVGDFSRHLGGVAGALTKSWEGDRLKFVLQAMGQQVSGFIDVRDTELRIEVLLPGVLGMLAGKIRSRLQKEGQILLEKK